MNLLPENLDAYIKGMYRRFDDPVLQEMEALAEEKGFPIVGRVCGAALEMLARSVGALRVFELGSGFGFSAWWFARAVGPEGSVTLTDGDAENLRRAREYLDRAGVAERCRFREGDAVGSLNDAEGLFDVVYCDIDKEGYPDAWRAAAGRVRIGGLYLCDNVLWKGQVADESENDEATRAIREHNELIYADERFLTTIIPLRDGILSALRIG